MCVCGGWGWGQVAVRTAADFFSTRTFQGAHVPVLAHCALETRPRSSPRPLPHAHVAGYHTRTWPAAAGMAPRATDGSAYAEMERGLSGIPQAYASELSAAGLGLAGPAQARDEDVARQPAGSGEG